MWNEYYVGEKIRAARLILTLEMAQVKKKIFPPQYWFAVFLIERRTKAFGNERKSIDGRHPFAIISAFFVSDCAGEKK